MRKIVSNQTLAGVLLALLSAASIAMGPVLARIAYNDGADVWAVTIGRGVVMILLCLFILTVQKRLRRSSKTTLLITTFSGIAFAFFSFGYFEAVNYLAVGLAVSIYFLHPLFVSIVSHMLKITPLKVSHMLAVIVTLGGLYLAVGTPGGDIPLKGVTYSLIAALSVTAMILLNAKALKHSDPVTVNLLMVTVTTVCLVAYVTVLPGGVNFPQSAAGWLSIMCVGGTFTAGLISFFYSVSMIGAVKSTMITCLQPAFATIFAGTLLNEFLQLQQLCGVAIIVIGLLIRDARLGSITRLRSRKDQF